MTPQQTANKIAELEFWLEHNPNHPDRTTIESDLRNLRLGRKNKFEIPHERDTFDLREHNFYNV